MDCLVLLSKSIKVAFRNKTVGCLFSLLFLKCKLFCAFVTFTCKKLKQKKKTSFMRKTCMWGSKHKILVRKSYVFKK